MSHTAHHLHSSYGSKKLPIHANTYVYTHAPFSHLLYPIFSPFQSPCNRFCQCVSTSALPWQRSWKSLQLFRQRQKHYNHLTDRQRGRERGGAREKERERGNCICMLCLWPFDELVFIDCFPQHRCFCWCMYSIQHMRPWDVDHVCRLASYD